jgi:hypothetical protein
VASSLVHVGLQATCPHGAQVSAVAAGTRVTVQGQAVTVSTDTFTVSGCTFMVGNKPQPCMTIKWLVPATRVKVGGQAVLLQDSTGLAQSADQIPAGPPTISSVQTRVKGT